MKCKCGPHGSKCDDDGECSCYDGFEKNGEGVCKGKWFPLLALS